MYKKKIKIYEESNVIHNYQKISLIFKILDKIQIVLIFTKNLSQNSHKTTIKLIQILLNEKYQEHINCTVYLLLVQLVDN